MLNDESIYFLSEKGRSVKLKDLSKEQALETYRKYRLIFKPYLYQKQFMAYVEGKYPEVKSNL